MLVSSLVYLTRGESDRERERDREHVEFSLTLFIVITVRFSVQSFTSACLSVDADLAVYPS